MHTRESRLAAALLSTIAIAIGGCDAALQDDPGAIAPVVGNAPLIERPAEIAEIRATLASGSATERLAAAREASRVRPFSIVEEDLVAALGDPDPELRLAAVESLSQSRRSDETAASLIIAFQDDDPRVRIAAALAVRDFREQAPELVAATLSRIGGRDSAEGRLAAEQLQFLWPAMDDDAFVAVIDLLNHPDTRIRQISALTMTKALVVRRNLGLNPITARLVEELTAALADIDADVRRDSARALELLGTKAATAWETLERRLQSEPDLEAGQAMMMAARSVDEAGRSSFPPARSAIWTMGPTCLPSDVARLAGLAPHDPDRALAALDVAASSLTAREGWRLAGPYVIFSYHYPTFAVDTANGIIERLSSRSPKTALPNGLRAGLSREAVLARLGAQPSPRANSAGIIRQRICNEGHDDLVVELEFDATGTVSELAITRLNL